MPSVEPVRAASYVPRRWASGTFPVSRTYNLRQMLYNYSHLRGRDHPQGVSSDQIIPSFPFSDVPIYADTVDLETLAFHDFWGCLLTPENVASRIRTDDLRYHAWVATKRIMESGIINLADEEALLTAVTDQFMVELSLVLLDLCPGPVVIFVDPRLHDDTEQMVARAVNMVTKFDQANVRRWRITVTLPATEEGIRAAQVLTDRYGISTNLSLVSCLPHASACIEAGARMVTMNVEPIMEWFEQQQRMATRVGYISQDHPGIETIQSCASFIRHNRVNTSLLVTDFRMWAELKQFGGIGGVALTKNQLDQIPMQKLTTWYPRSDDKSPATTNAQQAAYPSNYLNSRKGFLSSLPAEHRSLISAVLHVRLTEMQVCMETIEAVVWSEVKRRIELEKVPLEALYRRPSITDDPRALRRSKSSRSSKRSRSTARSSSGSSRRDKATSADKVPTTSTKMVEGIDYF